MFTQAQVFNILDVPLADIIEWAIELLSLGYDSANLRILAGLSHLNDRQEVTYYVNQSLEDFKISPLTGKISVIAYTAVIIKEFLRAKISQRRMLQEICKLCIVFLGGVFSPTFLIKMGLTYYRECILATLQGM
ncbi:hypothetical protein [Crocosphaera sp.]|uniref:hypothetical protein n=1 Tax=Crocosphaera sp. TaxID=2729996 RepID=UPI003F26A93E|nr:hypothetical protein [Crocosphaera sp.]